MLLQNISVKNIEMNDNSRDCLLIVASDQWKTKLRLTGER